jgi:hypothetical protein
MSNTFTWREIDIDEACQYSRRFFYPGGTDLGGADGLHLEIMPTSIHPWVAVFGFGSFGAIGANGAWKLPKGEQIFAVARGRAYIVNPEDPHQWQDVDIHPVTSVFSLNDGNLLVVSDLTGLVVYDRKGDIWVTPRIAWDGFQIIKVDDEKIIGLYEDIDGEEREFTVDLRSKQLFGGVESP